MIRPFTFFLVAQASHLYFGFALITACLFYGSIHLAIWANIIYCIIIAIKEAFVDPKVELPDEAQNGFVDWLTNMIGSGLGWGIFFLFK